MAKSFFTKDTITGVFAVVLGAAYLASTFRIPQMDAGDEVGPRAFPYIVAAVVIACGLALLLKELLNTKRQEFSFKFVADRGIWLRIVATMIAGIAYGLVLDWLGYLISTVIFMLVVCTMINVGKHKQNIIIAVVFSIFTFISFALILKLSLPRGVLGFLPF